MNMKLECDLSGIRKCMMSGLSLLLAGVLQAQNPIVQTCYTSDPAPMVHDGTLYVYTGHDEDHADFFWMQEWRVYSTKDMVNWTDHGSPLAIESFDWADDRALGIAMYRTQREILLVCVSAFQVDKHDGYRCGGG